MTAIQSHVEQLLKYVQMAAGTGVVAFGLAAAAMEWLSRLQRPEDRIRTRDWWTECWCKLGDSRWLQVPYKVQGAFLGGFNAVARSAHCYFRCGGPDVFSLLLLVAAVLGGAVVLWHVMGWWSLLYCGVGVILAFLGTGWSGTVDLLGGLWILATSIMIPFAGLHLLEAFPLPKALGLLILGSPLLWVCLTFWWTAMFVVRGLWRAAHGRANEPQFMGSPYVETWALAATASFVVTTAALLLGTAFDRNAAVPRSTLLLFVNAACDTLSLAALLLSVRWIMAHPVALRLVAGVLAPVLASAALAIASIWLGLTGSAHSLSLHECLRVLVARAPDADAVYLGPVFWVMHTVFIPLVILCACVMVLLIAKGLLHAAHWFFGKAAVNEKPHHMTAGLLLLLAAICGALKFIISE